jgi:hypothetical protein
MVAGRHLGQAEDLLLDLPGDWRFLPKPGPLNRQRLGRPVVNQCSGKSHVVLFESTALTKSLLRRFLVQRTKTTVTV